MLTVDLAWDNCQHYDLPKPVTTTGQLMWNLPILILKGISSFIKNPQNKSQKQGYPFNNTFKRYTDLLSHLH